MNSNQQGLTWKLHGNGGNISGGYLSMDYGNCDMHLMVPDDNFLPVPVVPQMCFTKMPASRLNIDPQLKDLDLELDEISFRRWVSWANTTRKMKVHSPSKFRTGRARPRQNCIHILWTNEGTPALLNPNPDAPNLPRFQKCQNVGIDCIDSSKFGPVYPRWPCRYRSWTGPPV